MTYHDAEGDGPMKHDYDDDSDLNEDAPGRSTNPFDRARQQAIAPDPHDDGLDDSFTDDYEEPERDTVQAGSSTEMYYEEEEGIDDLFAQEDTFEEEEDEVDEGPTLALVEEEPPEALFSDEEDTEVLFSEEEDTELLFSEEEDAEALFSEEEDADDLEAEAEEWPTTGVAASLGAARWQEEPSAESSDDGWQEEEEFLQDEDSSGPPWPYGLIAVAVLALVLLVAGGYGVIQQRQATEEEIRQLRAELATTASPVDVSASRQALKDMNAQNAELSRQVTNLERDNRRLTDMVAGLEAQLDAQQAAIAKAEAGSATAQAAAPQPAQPAAPAPQPTASKTPAATPVTATAAPTGNWFVNFGSYGQEPIAREWAGKLNPGSGESVLVTAEVNGRTIYRVRVVGLSSRDAAERVARQLESTYKLPKLWVGKQ
ncbi:MAG: hypothetical protein HKN19_00180 [Halioglobus sp.]|nr:hypothetical protein [Halioglobus sp.]